MQSFREITQLLLNELHALWPKTAYFNATSPQIRRVICSFRDGNNNMFTKPIGINKCVFMDDRVRGYNVQVTTE